MDNTFSNSGNVVQLPLPPGRMGSPTAPRTQKPHRMPEQVPVSRDHDWRNHSTDLELGCACETLLQTQLPVLLTPNDVVSPEPASNDLTHNAETGTALRVPLSADTLAVRCRQLKTTGALIKKQNDLVLYLVTGLLEVTFKGRDTESIPVLMRPVRLVLNEATSALPTHNSGNRRGQWCIESTFGCPVLNPAITALFSQLNAALPKHDLQRSPSELIASVRTLAEEHDTLAFQDRCQLGLATFVLETDTVDGLELPLPMQANRELFMQIVDTVNTIVPASLLNTDAGLLQPIAGQLSALVSTVLSDQGSLKPGIVSTIRSVQTLQIATPVKAHTLTQLDKALPELLTTHDTLNSLSHSLQAASGAANAALTDIVAAVGKDITVTDLKQWLALSSLPDLARLSAQTDSTETPLSHDLAHDSTLVLFQQALDQAVLLHAEQDTLQQQFDYSLLPDLQGLLALATELGEFAASGPDVVDANYFGARRSFSHFCHDRSLTTPKQQLDALNTLITTEQFRQLYCQNQTYTNAFGSAFQGVNTEWDQLRQRITLARSLRRVLKSDSNMRVLVNHQNAFFDWYRGVLPLLRQINDLMEAADHWVTFDSALSLASTTIKLQEAIETLQALQCNQASEYHSTSLWRMAQSVSLPDTEQHDMHVEHALLALQTLASDAAGDDVASMGEVLATLDWLTTASQDTAT